MKTLKHLCTIQNGSLIIKNKELWKRDIAEHEGQNVVVDIRKQQKIRSNPQNRYFHGVILKLISEETGGNDLQNREKIKEWLKFEFLGTEAISFHGKTRFLPKSTSKLTTTEFERFNEDCRRFAMSELNVFIPLPNEVPFEY